MAAGGTRFTAITLLLGLLGVVGTWVAVFRTSGPTTIEPPAVHVNIAADRGRVVPAASSAVAAPPSEVGPATSVTSEQFVYPESFIGTVWVRVSAARSASSQSPIVTLRWGAKEWRHRVRMGDGPVFLMLEKTGHDPTPLRVSVQPAASIAFGTSQEAPATGVELAINSGWT